MNLSKHTIEILKNFAAINMSIFQPAGSVMKGISPGKNVFAVARINESFPVDFSIYDLNQFLGTISLFDDPELDFSDKAVKIKAKDGSSRVNYTYADKEAIKSAVPPEKELKLPEPEVTFTLTNADLSQALKAASVMQLPHIAFQGRGGKLFITAIDNGNDSAHKWEKELGTTEHEFNLVHKVEVFKLLPREYRVGLSSKKITALYSSNKDIDYFVSAETASTFG